MAVQPITRRLAAILAADVAGYTRLMEEDTDGTVEAWQLAREEVIKPCVGDHSGKIVKLTGDGFLVEFPTVQDAVNCALILQAGLVSSILDFRMGVNLGDILDDGEDIHGEGVNIAARLEGIAEPGGICISGGVFDQVRNRIHADYHDLGEKEVKNVSAPVRVFSVVAKKAPAATEEAATEPDEIPSIAVLPFDNLSDDPGHDSFADGMTEDLITDLSKVSGLFVVARNSTFAYKGKSPDIRDVAADLGVRYVLEGSIRRAGEKVRINAQLIDAASGGHLWADRYDGSLDNVFELQDEVGAKVVAALSVQLTKEEEHCLSCVHTNNVAAYELFVQARATPYPPIPERINSAREMFERVIELDPDFAGGYAGVSSMLSFGAIWSHADESEAIERAENLAQKAIALDKNFGWSYTALGLALLLQKKYDAAIEAGTKAVSLQPSDANAHAHLGLLCMFDGQYDNSVASVDQAIRLNPQFFNGPYLNIHAQAHMLAGNYEASISAFDENVARQGPVGPPAYCSAVVAHEGLGQHDKAAEQTAILCERFPKFTTAGWNFIPLLHDAEAREKFVALLKAGGVPGD